MYEIAIALIIVGIAGIFTFITTSLKEEHSGLKLFFFLLTFFILTIGFFFSGKFIESNGDTSTANIFYSLYQTMIWITIFIAAYFMIYFVYKTVLWLNAKKQRLYRY